MLIHDRTKEVLETLNSSKVSRLATVDPEREPYIILVVFTFDGNNIFIPIDDKPKNQKNLHHFKRVKKIYKKIPIV